MTGPWRLCGLFNISQYADYDTLRDLAFAQIPSLPEYSNIKEKMGNPTFCFKGPALPFG